MIQHVVMWKLAAEDEPTRAQHAQDIRDALESLTAVIPQIIGLRVRRNAVPIDGNWDLGLVGEFADVAGLEAYLEHPAHREAAAVIRARVSGRTAIDLEI